jgi:hypothetical protein
LWDVKKGEGKGREGEEEICGNVLNVNVLEKSDKCEKCVWI